MTKLLLAVVVSLALAGGASAQCGPSGCSVPVGRFAVANVVSAPIRLVSTVGTVGAAADRPGVFERIAENVRERRDARQQRRQDRRGR